MKDMRKKKNFCDVSGVVYPILELPLFGRVLCDSEGRSVFVGNFALRQSPLVPPEEICGESVVL